MRARAAGVGLALVTLMGSCSTGAGGVGVAETTSTGPPRPLVWAAMGDSYSAGIGGPGATVSVVGCQQDQPDAFATVTLAELARSLPRQSFQQRFVACGGATTADVLSTQLPAARGADVASLTIGGNDLGFTQVVGTCIQAGCASYDQPADDLPGIAPDPGRTDWQTLTDRLTATFVAIREAMAIGGWLFVLSYPIPAPERLGATCPSGSAPLRPRDVVLADAMALRLGDAIAEASDRADTALTSTRPGHVVFVDWRVAADAPSRTTRTVDGVDRDVSFNPDGLCTSDPMINGITLADLGDSFHPTPHGVSIAARDLAGAIAPRVG